MEGHCYISYMMLCRADVMEKGQKVARIVEMRKWWWRQLSDDGNGIVILQQQLLSLSFSFCFLMNNITVY